MTVVPLPDVPCVRVRCVWNKAAAGEGGLRFYLSYSGSAPTGANCLTLAGDVSTGWLNYIAALMSSQYALEEVDVLDIATDSGLSAVWTGSVNGTRSGTSLPDQCATNVEFGIARRYRGGKPRMFLPPGNTGDLYNQSSYGSSFIAAVNTAVGNWITYLEGLSIGSMGTLQHVNLSYYKGFTNITNSSGRERAVPTYRATALHDNVTSYICKSVVGSQKRRRTSTTP